MNKEIGYNRPEHHTLTNAKSTFAASLRSCAAAKNLIKAKRIHQAILHDHQLRSDTYLNNLLIETYGKCGNPDEAWQTLRSGTFFPNVFSWTITVTAFADNLRIDRARQIFDAMPERNLVSWNSILAAFARSGHLAQARVLFDAMPVRDLVSWNSLLTGFSRAGDLDNTKDLFQIMPEWDVISCTAVLHALADTGDHATAKRLLFEMAEWSTGSCNAVISALAASGELEQARDVFETVMAETETEAARNLATWNVMMSAYSRAGRLEEARALFDRMRSRNIITWNSILLTYAQAGCLAEAEVVFGLMPERNIVTFTCMLQAYAENGLLHAAESVFDAMPEKNVVSWTTMFQAFARDGHREQEKLVFASMPERSLVSWNSLLVGECSRSRLDAAKSIFDAAPERNSVTFTVMAAAYAHAGVGSKALALVSTMSIEGLEADEMAVTSILSGCNHTGLVHEALLVFGLMIVDCGVSARPEHFGCLVDLLGRSGNFSKAMELVLSSPKLESRPAWGALLSACKLDRDLSRARYVSDRLTEMEPDCSSPHLLLASTICS